MHEFMELFGPVVQSCMPEYFEGGMVYFDQKDLTKQAGEHLPGRRYQLFLVGTDNAEPVVQVTTIAELATAIENLTVSDAPIVGWRTHDLVTGGPLNERELQELFTQLDNG